jgi:hypothetical protein
MTAVYGTSHTKTRTRATAAEMAARKAEILRLAREHQPASVRNIYYRAVVEGIVPKTNAGYAKVQRALVELRRSGEMPYEWLTDNVRWARRPDTWDGVDQVLRTTAKMYRRSLWTNAPETVEVWAESDSIAGVIWDVTDTWDVALLPVRGFSSLTFAYSSAQSLNAQNRPARIYYVGDHDPHGLEIEKNLRNYLNEWATVPIAFERLGVTWDQVAEMGLPGTSPKKGYGYPLAVEAEALPPNVLRDIVETAISEHVDERSLEVVRIAEESERELLLRFAESVR